MTNPVRSLGAWVQLARPAFLLVGILPFVLGTLLATSAGTRFRPGVFALGLVGVTLVMLATYFSGEYWDRVEDTLAGKTGQTAFSGGSQVVQRGLLPAAAAWRGALACVGAALVVGLVLQFVLKTGVWTIPLGLVGLVGGFFYSARPIRWVTRAAGEVWIALCYGWLPVAVGGYLQAGRIDPRAHWVAVPVGLTIFNVILLNEFPDYEHDRATGKRNLGVRLGLERAAVLYAAVSVLFWASVPVSAWRGLPAAVVWLNLPFIALSAVLVMMLLFGMWRSRPVLVRLCGANLVVNLGTTAAYIAAVAIR